MCDLAPGDPTPRQIRSVKTPPSDAFATPTQRTTALPPDLLREASRRLGVLALVIAAVAVIDLALGHTVFPRYRFVWPVALDVAVAGTAILSVGLFVYTRYAHGHPATFVRLGLIYEVALAAVLGVLNHLVGDPALMTAGPQISRIGVIVVIFPVFVPSTPRATLLAALVAASMDPLGMLAVIADQHLDVGLSHVFWMHLTNYLAAGVAVVMSHVITRLGREVRDARDLGSYRLGQLLGSGGMGEVYVAHHRLLARPAAIKLIRPEVLDARTPERTRVTIERFRREAEASATLSSPHTIELYDFGVSDEGVFYYVMELLDGVDLHTLVERFGPVPPERAIHLLRQACESLAEAHAHGLIHRDIKPSNIHLCRVGLAVDFVKLLDFGLVKPQPGREAPAVQLTAPDGTPGTPAFMAPEALLGDPAPDQRADIYALGCVGYWLVTGTLVFDAISVARMMMLHVEASPVPPSQRTELDIPPELDAAILACLAKSPDDRPASAQTLATLLATCPVREPWTEDRARHWWQQHLPAPALTRDSPRPGGSESGLAATGGRM